MNKDQSYIPLLAEEEEKQGRSQRSGITRLPSELPQLKIFNSFPGELNIIMSFLSRSEQLNMAQVNKWFYTEISKKLSKDGVQTLKPLFSIPQVEEIIRDSETAGTKAREENKKKLSRGRWGFTIFTFVLLVVVSGLIPRIVSGRQQIRKLKEEYNDTPVLYNPDNSVNTTCSDYTVLTPHGGTHCNNLGSYDCQYYYKTCFDLITNQSSSNCTNIYISARDVACNSSYLAVFAMIGGVIPGLMIINLACFGLNEFRNLNEIAKKESESMRNNRFNNLWKEAKESSKDKEEKQKNVESGESLNEDPNEEFEMKLLLN